MGCPPEPSATNSLRCFFTYGELHREKKNECFYHNVTGYFNRGPFNFAHRVCPSQGGGGCSRLSKTRSAVTKTLKRCNSHCTHNPFRYQGLQTVLLLMHSPPAEPSWVIVFLLLPAKQNKAHTTVCQATSQKQSEVTGDACANGSTICISCFSIDEIMQCITSTIPSILRCW